MAASPSIFLVFIVLLAGIALSTSNSVHGSAGFGFETGVVHKQHSDNNDSHSETRFGFGNKINTESGASAEHQTENNNDGHSGSQFSFPSAAGIVFRGGNRANSEADANEHQIGPNEQSHEHHHYNQHNQSSYNNINDTEGERKFRWPSSIPISISRSNEQNQESGAVADDLTGPNRLSHEDPQYLLPHTRSPYNSDTGDERKFHWPSSIGITITRSNEQNPDSGAVADSLTGPNRLIHEDPQYHHTRSAYNSDTDDERKFRWPGSMSIGISRSNEQNQESGAVADYFKGQSGLNYEHHHHDNHSALKNDTDGERKFRWPSSIGITITRSNKPNSDEGSEEKFFGLIPSIVPCNHTEQAGRSCSDCTHTLLCFANDIGIQRNCSPLYCNQGRCAVEPSSECSSAS